MNNTWTVSGRQPASVSHAGYSTHPTMGLVMAGGVVITNGMVNNGVSKTPVTTLDGSNFIYHGIDQLRMPRYKPCQVNGLLALLLTVIPDFNFIQDLCGPRNTDARWRQDGESTLQSGLGRHVQLPCPFLDAS